ncbi:unnamed protein product [Brugia timori]|uniref:Glyco_transf_7N domain-containing protein n=1 Tax=Brugia timori TaxID=42155 RepID=A0A0R3QHA2_9BILA|nr:unnamed protein product [Brugia timori]
MNFFADFVVLLIIKKKYFPMNFYRISTSVLRQKFLKLLLSSVIHQTTLSNFIRHRFKRPFKIDQFKQKDYMNASNFCPTFDEITDFSGPLSMGPLLINNLKEQEVAQRHSYIKSGGHWKPRNCLARHKIAIIIPFRDRQSHLTRLLDFLFPILKHQNLDFRFIITEQVNYSKFCLPLDYKYAHSFVTIYSIKLYYLNYIYFLIHFLMTRKQKIKLKSTKIKS